MDGAFHALRDALKICLRRAERAAGRLDDPDRVATLWTVPRRGHYRVAGCPLRAPNHAIKRLRDARGVAEPWALRHRWLVGALRGSLRPSHDPPPHGFSNQSRHWPAHDNVRRDYRVHSPGRRRPHRTPLSACGRADPEGTRHRIGPASGFTSPRLCVQPRPCSC